MPPSSATRSTVVGVERGNFVQPESSGPAVALLLNHTAWVVIYTCEYCAGALPVCDTSVREEHPASRAHRLQAWRDAAEVQVSCKIPVRPRGWNDAPTAVTLQCVSR